MSDIADASVCHIFSGRVSRAKGSSALFVGMSGTTNGTREQRGEDAGGVLLLTMIEAARVLSIGRTTMYELVGAGEIDVVRIGRSVRVPVDALQVFVDQQRASQ